MNPITVIVSTLVMAVGSALGMVWALHPFRLSRLRAWIIAVAFGAAAGGLMAHTCIDSPKQWAEAAARQQAAITAPESEK